MNISARFIVFLLTTNAFAITNGKKLEGSPDVVRLTFNNGWVCSGVYIDAHTILTAAHCITPDSANFQLTKIQTTDDEVLEAQQVALIPHPDYSAQFWPSRDVGLIKTSKNDKFENKFHLETSSIRVLGEATLYGCGKTDPAKSDYARVEAPVWNHTSLADLPTSTIPLRPTSDAATPREDTRLSCTLNFEQVRPITPF